MGRGRFPEARPQRRAGASQGGGPQLHRHLSPQRALCGADAFRHRAQAAGVVEAGGSAVTDLKVGDRVAYANGPLGSYSELKVHPADRLVKLPDGISFEQAASMMLQGLTVQYLLRRMHVVPKAGDTILWHAAAGGIGLIACQWAKAVGVNLIGTVSTE